MRQRVVRIAGFLVVSAAAAIVGAGSRAVTDVRVNVIGTPPLDQVETAIARRPADSVFRNGLLCAAWFQKVPSSLDQMRYGSSEDGGVTWTDGGLLLATPNDTATFDPDIAYRFLDEQFYILGHNFPDHLRGIAVHVTDGCTQESNWDYVEVYRQVSSGLPDKPMMSINNWAGPAGNPRDPSKFHDRIYVTSDISTNQGRTLAIWRYPIGINNVWSPAADAAPVAPYPASYDSQRLAGLHGAWSTSAPNGRLYVAWLRYQQVFGTGPIDIQVSRSTDGGNSFQMEQASPLIGGRNPNTPGSNCTPGPGLKGSVNLVPSPQIEADDLGYVHMVYTAGDPVNSADYSNVYYTRGTPGVDGALSWSAPLRLNTDTDSSADQFMPSLMVAKGTSKIAVYWYDRRAATDPSNPQFQIYRRLSTNRGASGSWGPNILVSDVISPPPSSSGGGCDALGHYNRGIADPYNLYMIWADRRTQSTPIRTNVFFERVNIAGVCTVSYCAGEGTRCSNTGSSETCCAYQSVEDWTCTGPDLIPPNACPCALLQ